MKLYFFNLVSFLTNFAFPLIYSSYIFRLFGPELNGAISRASNILAITIAISSFSIQSYGVRELATVSSSKASFSKTFNKLFKFNVVINVLVFIAFTISIVFTDSLTFLEKKIFFITSLTIIVSSINIDYVYISREKFKELALRTALIKTILLVFILFIITRKEQIYLYLIVTTSLTLVANLILILKSSLKLEWKLSFTLFIETLREIYKYHLMNLSMVIYRRAPQLIITILLTNNDLGIFSFAERFIIVVMTFGNLITSTFQPRIFAIAKYNPSKFIESFKPLFILTILTSGLLTITFYSFSFYIQSILGGEQYVQSLNILKLGAFIFIISSTSNCLTSLILITKYQEKSLTIYALASSIISVPLIWIITKIYGGEGAIIGLVLAESLMFVLVAKKSLEILKVGRAISSKIILAFVAFYMLIISILLVSNEILSNHLFKGLLSTVIYALALVCLYIIFKNKLNIKFEYLHKT